MKIKIVNDIDMRLWKRDVQKDKVCYKLLLDYVCQTFEFVHVNDFRITFKDDDDTQTTIGSQEDLDDAISFAQKSDKKSLKLYIAACNDPLPQQQSKNVEQKETEPPIQSNISSYTKLNKKCESKVNNDHFDKSAQIPSSEQINAFLSDDVVIHLLSDLFVAVFEALQSSNFELSFIECVQAIILSSDNKYDKITSNAIWPYFMNEVLAKKANFMVPFVANMMKANGQNMDISAIKQWIPTILNMLKQRAQNGNVGGFDGWRGRGRGHWQRGRGRGRGRGCGRGWKQFYENFHNFGDNEWFKVTNQNDKGDDDEIEQETFEYTEELVAIMNMGFTQMQKIKKLLNEHKGDKQRVVQELVAAK